MSFPRGAHRDSQKLWLEIDLLTCFCQWMRKSSRLTALTSLLQDGKTHKADELAEAFSVTARTIYRDMAQLQASGVPVKGTPGEGYRATAEVTVPPLSLTGAELEVLRLGISVIADAGEDAQKAAAETLHDKLELALGQDLGSTAIAPITANAQIQRHLAQVRLAISARRKLRVTVRAHTSTIRPLRVDFFGRIWRCVCWDEGQNGFDALPLVEVSFVAVLPGLFVDEPGKTLKDYLIS